MAKRKPKHYTGSNPERVRADLARRSSGAAGTHVSGKRGARTRKGSKQEAIRENIRSW